MVCVQKFQDFLLGFPSAIALKGLHIYSLGILLAQARRELDLAMHEIIVRYESADEPDDDGRPFCGSLVRWYKVRRIGLVRAEYGCKEDINTNRRKHPAE
jgi:hypothetical protein